MRPSQNRQLADALLPGVLATARLQMRYFQPGLAFETKEDSSPVTVADRESEKILVDALRHAAPGVPVVAEEAVSAGHRVTVGRSFFLVDPLDGTRQFIQQVPEFTINIALVEDERPVFGLIYAPALGHLFVTGDDGEAFEAFVVPTDKAATLAELALTPLQARTPDFMALSVVESRIMDRAKTERILGGFGIASHRPVGSSLKFCLIARGEADVYVRIGLTSEWDTAAGQAILTAAGGIVTDLEGRELRCGHAGRNFLNPHFIAAGQPLKGLRVSACAPPDEASPR